MVYSIDHVRACEPATMKKQAPLPKKICTGLGNQPSIKPIQCGDLDSDQNDSQDQSDRITTRENRRS